MSCWLSVVMYSVSLCGMYVIGEIWKAWNITHVLQVNSLALRLLQPFQDALLLLLQLLPFTVEKAELLQGFFSAPPTRSRYGEHRHGSTVRTNAPTDGILLRLVQVKWWGEWVAWFPLVSWQQSHFCTAGGVGHDIIEWVMWSSIPAVWSLKPNREQSSNNKALHYSGRDGQFGQLIVIFSLTIINIV